MQPKVKKTVSSKSVSKAKRDLSFPLEKDNFMLIGAGIVFIILGYFLMAQNSVEGFVPTVVSPILLVIGYCVLIPYGILKRPKSAKAQDYSSIAADPNVVPDTVKSNIKTG